MANKEISQIPNKDKEAGLLSFCTLLDKILKPKINKIKKGIPISNNPAKVSDQTGKIESWKNGGYSKPSTFNHSKLPIENPPIIRDKITAAETNIMMTPINFPITLKMASIILPMVSKKSLAPLFFFCLC